MLIIIIINKNRTNLTNTIGEKKKKKKEMSWDSIKNTRLALHPPRLSHHLPGQTSETQPGKLWSEAWQAHCSTWALCSSKVNGNRHPHKHLEKGAALDGRDLIA